MLDLDAAACDGQKRATVQRQDASAFRSAHTCVVNSRDLACGAVVVPLITAAGWVGVLAIELDMLANSENRRARWRPFLPRNWREWCGATRSAEEGQPPAGAAKNGFGHQRSDL